MVLSLSISRIADSIYAQAALDAATRSIETPAALTRDHHSAITNLIVKLTAETISSLGPIVKKSTIDTLQPDDDIITIDCDVRHHDATVACLRTNIETAIAYGVLARATAGADITLAKWYASLAKTAAIPLNQRIRRSA